MPLSKLQLSPGIDKEVTSYATEGGYFSGDHIRFRYGFPEKLGGWANYSPPYTFKGVPRSMWNWITFDGYNLLSVGTSQKYYVENGGQYFDITPVRLTLVLAANSIATTNGSPLVTITATAHSATVGSFVTITGATAVGGITLSGQYEIITVIDGNTFTVLAAAPAGSTATGGGTPTLVFQINAGSTVYTTSAGWGAGSWGGGGWGIGLASATVSFPLQLWSQNNFYQDLVFANRGGAIYYWLKDTVTYNVATTLAAYASTQQKWATTATSTITSTTIAIADATGVSSGSTVTGAGVPAGTYVTTAYTGGLSVTLSATATVTNAQALIFSYSGYQVPNNTNFVFISSIYSFVIALGSNSYSAINFGTPFDPMIVRWSDQGNASEWVPSTSNQSGQQRLSNGSYLVTAQNNRQEILVWTNSALYSMQYLGPPYVFGFNLLMDNISIVAPNAAITANNVTYWMGEDKFYFYNGVVSTLPCTLKRFVFSNINLSQINQVIAGHNEAYNEVWWFYPTSGSYVNNSYVIYNYEESIWYYGTLNRTAWLDSSLRNYPLAAFAVQNSYLSATLSPSATSLTLINSTSYPSSGTVLIDSEQISYTSNSSNTLSGLTRGVNVTVAASHTQYAQVMYSVPNQVLYHELGVDDNTVAPTMPIPAYIESSDFGIAQGEQFGFVWRIIPDITFTNSIVPNPQVYLTVKPRVNPGTAYVTPVDQPVVVDGVLPPLPPTTQPIEQYTGQVYTRVRGREMAFRLDSYGLGVQWQMGTMRLDVRADGRK